MRRLSAPCLALVVAACTSKASPTGDRLLPDDATLLVGVDVAGVLESKLFGVYAPQLPPSLLGLGLGSVALDCGIDPLKLRPTLLVGTDGEHAIGVFTGDGVGDETRLICAANAMSARGGDGFIVVERTGLRGVWDDHKVVATVVDPRTVAFAVGPWVNKLADRLEFKGVAAMDGPVAPLFERPDRGAHLWVAGRIPTPRAAELAPSIGAEPHDIVLQLDLKSGFLLKVDIGFGTPEQIKKIEPSVTNAASTMRAFGPMMGFSQKTTDSMVLAVAGTEVRFAMQMPTDELLTLLKKTLPEPTPPPPDYKYADTYDEILELEKIGEKYRRDHQGLCPNDTGAYRLEGTMFPPDLIDAWGRDYTIECVWGTDAVALTSHGPNGVPGDADDITSKSQPPGPDGQPGTVDDLEPIPRAFGRPKYSR
jgi:hypothetical protein